MARKAQMSFNLNFAPKKERVRRAAANSMSPEINGGNATSGGGVGSAQAIHGQQHHGHGDVAYQQAAPTVVAPGSLSAQTSDDGSLRPNFKRLPSHTLEASHAKRQMYRWGQEEAIEDTDSDADSAFNQDVGDARSHTADSRISRSGSVATSYSDASAGGASGASSVNASPYLGNSLNVHAGSVNMNPPSSHLRTNLTTNPSAYKVPGVTQAMMERFRRQSAPTSTRPNATEFVHPPGPTNLHQSTTAHSGIVGLN